MLDGFFAFKGANGFYVFNFEGITLLYRVLLLGVFRGV